MKILVFGKSGQVARELQRFENVIALNRNDADLTDPDVCAKFIAETDADVVINAAAYTAVDKAEHEPELARLVNTTAPAKMAQAAANRAIPFLHISTDYVFNGQGDAPFRPDAPTGPLCIYGQTKLDGEREVIAANGPHIILRTSWVFSVHGSNFVKTMLRLGEERSQLSVVSDQIGGPTPAAEIAATLVAIAKAFAAGQGKSGVYHYSGIPSISWSGFAREIFRQARMNVTINDIPATEFPTPARRPMNSRLDCSNLRADYHIMPPDWRAGLADVLRELEKSA